MALRRVWTEHTWKSYSLGSDHYSLKIMQRENRKRRPSSEEATANGTDLGIGNGCYRTILINTPHCLAVCTVCYPGHSALYAELG
jgi:hypothetical protein